MGWDHGAGWGGGIAMGVGMTVFWIAVAVAVVVALRTSLGGRPSRGAHRDAQEILEARLARGEIDVEEYRRRVDALSATDR